MNRRIIPVLILLLVGVLGMAGCGQTQPAELDLSPGEIDKLIKEGKTTKEEKDRDGDGKPDLIKHYYDNQLIKREDLPYKAAVKDHPLGNINLNDISKIEYRNYEFIHFITIDKHKISQIYETIIKETYIPKLKCISYYCKNRDLVGSGGGGGHHNCGLSLYFMNGDEVLMKITGHETDNHFPILIPAKYYTDYYNDELGPLLIKMMKQYEEDLSEHLKSEDPRVSASAAHWLGMKGKLTIESLDIVIETIRNAESGNVCVLALEALCSLNDKAVIPKLIELLDIENEEVLSRVSSYLKIITGQFRGTQATKEMVEPLKAWWKENQAYLYWPEGKYHVIIDEEAKKAGIPTGEYRKTHPWPEEESKDK